LDGAIGISHKPPPKSSPGRGGLKKINTGAAKVSPAGGDLEGAKVARQSEPEMEILIN